MLLNKIVAARVMDAEGLDGLLGATPENVMYMSGLEASGHLVSRYTTNVFALAARADLTAPVVVAGLGDIGAIRLLCPPSTRIVHHGRFKRYVDEGAALTEHEQWVKRWVVDTPAHASALEALVAGLETAGLSRSRVGYDEKGLDPHLPAALRERLPQLELVPAWRTLRQIRLVKTPEEIERLTSSLRLTEESIRAAVAVAAPGAQEEDLIREFRRSVVVGGGDPLFNEITFQRRAAVGALPIQDGILAEGDIIRFDVGCKVEGYCSDLARLFVFRGEVSQRAQRLYDAMKAGEDAGMKAMRPGTTAQEVFEATVAAVKDAGVSDYQRNHVGHAVGLEVYDGCLLSPGDTTTLEEGMTFEIETPYYEIGFLGVQIEDTVVIRHGTVEMISSLSRDIEYVG